MSAAARDYKGYELVKISNTIPEDKWKKAVRSGKVTLKAEDLKGNKPVLMHPSNAKLIVKAQKKNKGVVSMPLAGSDLLYDMELHKEKSVFAWLEGQKNKKAYNWMYSQE